MIAAELLKQTHRPGAWVTLAVTAAVSVLLAVVIGLTRPELPERIGDFGAVVSNTSGFTMPLVALSAAVVFMLPLGVAVFAGEAFAGEAAWGSLRSCSPGPSRGPACSRRRRPWLPDSP